MVKPSVLYLLLLLIPFLSIAKFIVILVFWSLILSVWVDLNDYKALGFVFTRNFDPFFSTVSAVILWVRVDP